MGVPLILSLLHFYVKSQPLSKTLWECEKTSAVSCALPQFVRVKVRSLTSHPVSGRSAWPLLPLKQCTDQPVRSPVSRKKLQGKQRNRSCFRETEWSAQWSVPVSEWPHLCTKGHYSHCFKMIEKLWSLIPQSLTPTNEYFTLDWITQRMLMYILFYMKIYVFCWSVVSIFSSDYVTENLLSNRVRTVAYRCLIYTHQKLWNLYMWLSYLRPLIGSEALNNFLLTCTWLYGAVHRNSEKHSSNTSYMQFCHPLWVLVWFRLTDRMKKNKSSSKNIKKINMRAQGGI